MVAYLAIGGRSMNVGCCMYDISGGTPAWKLIGRTCLYDCEVDALGRAGNGTAWSTGASCAGYVCDGR